MSEVDKDIKNIIETDDDDEAVVQMAQFNENDKLLREFEAAGLVEQNNNSLSYSISNIYSDKNESKYRHINELVRNPPILTIKDGKKNRVDFLLTKNFNHSLLESLTDVDKAYLGFKKTKKRTKGKNFNFIDMISDVMQKYMPYIMTLIVGLIFGEVIVSNSIYNFINIAILGVALIVLFVIVHKNKKNKKGKKEVIGNNE